MLDMRNEIVYNGNNKERGQKDEKNVLLKSHPFAGLSDYEAHIEIALQNRSDMPQVFFCKVIALHFVV